MVAMAILVGLKDMPEVLPLGVRIFTSKNLLGLSGQCLLAVDG